MKNSHLFLTIILSIVIHGVLITAAAFTKKSEKRIKDISLPLEIIFTEDEELAKTEEKRAQEEIKKIVKKKIIEDKAEIPEKKQEKKKEQKKSYETKANKALNKKIRLKYESLIASWLEKNKNYPKRALRLGLEDQLQAYIKINRNGEVVSSQITQYSKYNIFNDEVISMISKSNPFPKFPKEIKDNYLEFQIPIYFEFK